MMFSLTSKSTVEVYSIAIRCGYMCGSYISRSLGWRGMPTVSCQHLVLNLMCYSLPKLNYKTPSFDIMIQTILGEVGGGGNLSPAPPPSL